MEHTEARLLDHEQRISSLERGQAVTNAELGHVGAALHRIEAKLDQTIANSVSRAEHDLVCSRRVEDREETRKEIGALSATLTEHVETHADTMRKALFWGITALISAIFAATFIAKGVLR